MCFGSVQIISCLDSQSKFPMFTLFSGRHIGGLWRSIAGSIPGSMISRGTFRQISQLWDNAQTWITVFFVYRLNFHNFLTLSTEQFLYYFLLLDNEHTLQQSNLSKLLYNGHFPDLYGPKNISVYNIAICQRAL